jgi:hypothetical protein
MDTSHTRTRMAARCAAVITATTFAGIGLATPASADYVNCNTGSLMG